MNNSRTRRILLGTLGVAALALPLASCSVGSIGGGGSDGDGLTISVLIASSGEGAETMDAMGKAFTAANPDIQVKVETQPGGGEGDNLMKTKLSTGEMNTIFGYNSGSQLQGLKPDENLIDLSGEAWVADLTEDMKTVVSGDKGLYGAPLGASFGGAVLYNKAIYAEL